VNHHPVAALDPPQPSPQQLGNAEKVIVFVLAEAG
jgi:hypothetical protein